MKTPSLLAAVVLFLFSALSPQTLKAKPQIDLDAVLGQSVLLSGKSQRAYLRITIKGIRYHDEVDRTPVNIAIVIDRSGSMRGEKLAQAKEAAIMAINRLSRDDIVSVVAYSHNVDVIVPATRVTHTSGMIDEIRYLRADGRTALYAGVKQGVRELKEYLSRNRVNRTILISDGLANVGPSTPGELGELGRRISEDGISVTTIGLGLGYNEDLMSKLAFTSDGNHAFVEHPTDLVKIFNQEFGDILSVVGQEIEIEVRLRQGVRPLRSLGRSAEIKGNRARFRLNQIYGSQEKHAVLELEIPKDFRGNSARIADVTVNYTSMKNKTKEKISEPVEVRFTKSVKEAEASVNKQVMTTVTTQIATEKNERAVILRDQGRIGEARKVLEENAAYLSEQAKRLNSEKLEKLRKSNLDDARSLSAKDWNRTRKSMRAKQYKDKTQQSY